MRTVVAILVYDRLKNIEHWLNCWRKCDYNNSQLVVVHNTKYGVPDIVYEGLCKEYFVQYVSRMNIGYDIAAFQDVCRNRLYGFPDYDNLLWVTDDVFPMSTDFVQQFNDEMKQGVGVVAMEISHSVKRHIRTSGFMIRKEVAEKLTFPADPVTTKKECYDFEHMGSNTFLEQVLSMGFKVVEVSGKEVCPLWDSGYPKRLPRAKEHAMIFGPAPVQPAYIAKRAYL